MDKFSINGPCRVRGTIYLSGSKNASLPILAASILFDEPVEIKNLPKVKDIETMLDLIKSLGFSIKKNKIKNSVIIKKKNQNICIVFFSKNYEGWNFGSRPTHI